MILRSKKAHITTITKLHNYIKIINKNKQLFIRKYNKMLTILLLRWASPYGLQRVADVNLLRQHDVANGPWRCLDTIVGDGI